MKRIRFRRIDNIDEYYAKLKQGESTSPNTPSRDIRAIVAAIAQSGILGAKASAAEEVVEPARLPRPLATRDVQTLLVAHAIEEQCEQAEQEVAGGGYSAGEVIPPEAQAWARSALGKEACTCSIHCPALRSSR